MEWRLNSFEKYYNESELFIDKEGSYLSGNLNADSYYFLDFSCNSIFDIYKMIRFIIKKVDIANLTKIRFFYNKDSFPFLLVLLGFVVFRTRTEIIYFTNNKKLQEKIQNKIFYYSYLDSDENI